LKTMLRELYVEALNTNQAWFYLKKLDGVIF
jgi:hypothetical protein